MPEKMKLIIQGPTLLSFKAFIQITKGINPTHCLYMSSDGVYTQNIDESLSALYDAWFPREWFHTYIWNPSHDLEHIILNTNQLCMAVAAVPNDANGIRLELNGKQDHLVISVLTKPQNNKQKDSDDSGDELVVDEQFEIRRLDIEFEKMNVLNKDCDVVFVMSAKELFELIRKHRQFGDTTLIRCDHKKFEILTVGECKARRFFETSALEEFSIKDPTNTNLRLVYNTANLEKMLKFHQYVPNAKVKVHIDGEHPLTFVFSNSNQSLSNKSYVRAFIAPMVDDSGIVDDDDGCISDDNGESGDGEDSDI